MNNSTDIESLCLLLDEKYRRRGYADNRGIIFTILDEAHVVLGDEGMLSLLEKLTQTGDFLPWAYDGTDADEEELMMALNSVSNGLLQPRYYVSRSFDVCGRTYYISNQWHNHVRYPHQPQSKKALLELICGEMSPENAVEFMGALKERAMRVQPT